MNLTDTVKNETGSSALINNWLIFCKRKLLPVFPPFSVSFPQQTNAKFEYCRCGLLLAPTYCTVYTVWLYVYCLVCNYQIFRLSTPVFVICKPMLEYHRRKIVQIFCLIDKKIKTFHLKLYQNIQTQKLQVRKIPVGQTLNHQKK